MQKRRLFWLFGITFFVMAGIVGTLVGLVKYEPDFYRRNKIPPSTERKASADKLLMDFVQMLAFMRERQENWYCDAKETQINAFFAEEHFTRHAEAESLKKLGLSSPCVAFEDDRVRLAFRFGTSWFSTVISYEFRFWLVPKEMNVVAVQILSARAGALPISRQLILTQLSEFARRQNSDATLYRYENTPVAIVRLKPEETNPNWTLTMLKVEENTLKIQGKTLEHALAPPTLPPPSTKTTAAPTLP